MNDTDNHDGSGLDAIENSIRKTIDERPSQISVHYGRCERGSANTLDGLVQRCTKHRTQAAALTVVPAKGFEDVLSGFVEKNNAGHGSPLSISA